jgi:oxalate decarboxylase/phosphoglucose isomerase-like protein (cupin superfamily)
VDICPKTEHQNPFSLPHPNSVQHTAVIKGSGKIIIGKDEKEVQTFDPQEMQLIWHVIAKNVPHAVANGGRTMVVFSFHTCTPSELLEIETLSGRSRFYESQ